MKQLVKDLAKREAIKQELIAKFAVLAAKNGDPAIADAWKPTIEYPIYVVYLYDLGKAGVGGPYNVGFEGFESEIRAQLFAEQTRNKPMTLDVTICDAYPWEFMVNDSKKPAKQKSKSKKQ